MLSTESRAHSAIVKGVRANAKAPMRSAKPPIPLRVLNRSESLIGVSHVLYVTPTSLPTHERFDWGRYKYSNLREDNEVCTEDSKDEDLQPSSVFEHPQTFGGEIPPDERRHRAIKTVVKALPSIISMSLVRSQQPCEDHCNQYDSKNCPHDESVDHRLLMIAIYRVEIFARPGIAGAWQVSSRIAPVMNCSTSAVLNVPCG